MRDSTSNRIAGNLPSIFVVVAVACLGAGSVTTDTAMVCFAPTTSVADTSPAGMLAELNKAAPEPVAEEDFACYPGRNGLVCWAVVARGPAEKGMRRVLKRDARFETLAVGYLCRRDKDMLAMFDTGNATTAEGFAALR